MSERVINDPSVAGWELDTNTGYWMWAAGSGGGSIQDGDTEGQITTWDGTEWTPSDDMTVNSGIMKLFDRGSGDGELRLFHEDDATTLLARGSAGSAGTFSISTSDGGTASERMSIDADGAVNVTSSTDTTKLNITNSVGTYELTNNEYGSLAINYNDTERFVLASNGDVYISGKLFVGGEEVGAGGGGGLWTDNGDGSISYSGTAKATDFVTT